MVDQAGNAAWKALYDERGNPQAAELFIVGNVPPLEGPFAWGRLNEIGMK